MSSLFPFPSFIPRYGNDQYTKILLHFDGTNGSTTFTDSNAGGGAHTWSATGTPTISTTQSKFGGSSLTCGAAAGYITTGDSSDFTLGSSDWTVDCWFYRNGGDGTQRMIFGHSNTDASSLALDAQLYTTNKIITAVNPGGVQITSTTTYTTTGWHHFAYVRTGNTLKLFLDGVQEGGDTAFSGSVTDSTGSFAVGNLGVYNVSNPWWNGWIDEFRLSVGIARWTSNFTPPAFSYS